MPEATFYFPPDFVWGVATSAYQVEGQNSNSQWWAWEEQSGHIQGDGRSGAAANWWQDADADFARAEALGMQTLRLSIEWSRVEVAPSRIDTAALDRYREMLRQLRARGIQPLVTLHHFSEPLWFTLMGGWLNADAVAYFVRYVELVVNALRDDVSMWCTFNEPSTYAIRGYLTGRYPPGHRNPGEAQEVLLRLLTAHAAAYRRIHALQPEAQVGLAHAFRYFEPANPRNPLDRLVTAAYGYGCNAAAYLPLHDGWLRLPLGAGLSWNLRHTLDWIGINYYTREHVAFDRESAEMAYGHIGHAAAATLLDDGSELYPQGLARAIKTVARLRRPIYITANGVPDADEDQRPAALMLHVHQMWKALQDNTPVRGYYYWSLVDGFEWDAGWRQSFGLIQLDPATQQRSLRPTANLYGALARGNALTPELFEAYAPTARAIILPG